MFRACVLACALGVGCTETVELGSGRLSGLEALDIRPPSATAIVSDLGAGSVEMRFLAIGTFVDGTRRDVTKLVEWTVDNPAPGEIFEGTYLTTNSAGGRAVLRARAVSGDNVVEAHADVHVIIALDLVDGVFPPPIGAENLFAPDLPTEVGGPRAPALLYPASGTLFPQDLSRIVFQLGGAPATDAFRWRLLSESLQLSFLTGGSRWQPDSALWSLIAATHPGSQVSLLVEAASSNQPGTIHAAPEARLQFARAGGGGVLYHWSAATSAIMRGTLSSETATKFFPQDPVTTCAACHAVSRDGKQMALGYDGENLRTIDLESQAPIIAAPLRPMGWATFSPDGRMLVVADKGTLTLRDATTGNPIGPNMGRLPVPLRASHPDWSPDGRYVVMTLTNDALVNMTVGSGSIARIAYQGGVWGATEILVAGSPSSNNYFPKYSPDGRFIAYVNASGQSQGAPDAELRMIRAEGGAPMPLGVANGGIDLRNTMPTWSPQIDENLAWLAFASARPYGEILAKGTSQIWITGIDLTRAELGVDPSFPPFWLPSQAVGVPNHNPIWAPQVQPTN